MGLQGCRRRWTQVGEVVGLNRATPTLCCHVQCNSLCDIRTKDWGQHSGAHRFMVVVIGLEIESCIALDVGNEVANIMQQCGGNE